MLIPVRRVAVALLLTCACVAFAKPPFLKVFLATYKIDPNSTLGKAKCLTCHEKPAPPRLNAYGKAVQSAMEAAHARMVTAEMLKSVEKKDSDKDGFSNIREIHAGTLPGDASSKPAKHAKKSAFNPEHGYTVFGAGLLPVALLALVWGRRRSS